MVGIVITVYSTQAKRYVTESEAILEEVPDELKIHRAPHGMPPHGMPPHGMPPHGKPPVGARRPDEE